jgi:hypothetical protein
VEVFSPVTTRGTCTVRDFLFGSVLLRYSLAHNHHGVRGDRPVVAGDAQHCTGTSTIDQKALRCGERREFDSCRSRICYLSGVLPSIARLVNHVELAGRVAGAPS